MPEIVKLHLSFLADSKCSSFLKTKLKEIHVIREKKNPLYTISPVIVSLYGEFELL